MSVQDETQISAGTNSYGVRRKNCTFCGQPKLLKDFPVIRKPNNDLVRAPRCIDCVRDVQQRKRLAKEKDLEYSALREWVGKLRGDAIQVPHVSEFTAALLQKYKGLDGFIDRWYGHIESAYQKDPSSKIVLENMKAVSRLVIASTQLRPSAPDMQGISDEELERELVHATRAEAEHNPALAVELLKSMGYAVVSPEEQAIIDDDLIEGELAHIEPVAESQVDLEAELERQAIEDIIAEPPLDDDSNPDDFDI